METQLTFLAIFAHPDDEIGSGATLARYSDAGHRIVLVCASRGEAATIYCDACATRENLAEVRTRELEAACRHIGIGELRWLDWPDGGIKEMPRAAAVGQVVRLIREIQPDVIITHPETGLYPHPDHLAVWEIVRAAFNVAADGDEYPGAGAAWAAARLFTRAISQSFFDAAPAFAQYRVQLNGQQLPFIPTPDDQVDVTMRVEPWVDRRMAAWDCHRSQHNPDGAFANVPQEVRRAMAANEQFILAAARVPLPEGLNDDLLAGLVRGQPEPVAVADDVTALRAALAFHRAHLLVCDNYAHTSSEPSFVALARDLTEGHQEAIYLLARALRRAGAPAGEVEADRRIVTESWRQADATAKVRFLSAASQQAIAGYQAQAATGSAERATWEELAALAQAQAATIRRLTG
jgi:mycothiol S-conjugate amidase